MKIGIDCRPMQWSLRGGVTEYMRHLIPALVSVGENHEFIGFWNSFGNEPIEKFPGVTSVRHHIPNKLFNPSLRFLGVPKLNHLMGNCDIVFLPNLNFSAVSNKTKLIVTVHDCSFVHFPECFTIKQKLWHKAIAPKQLLRRADHVVTVSEHTKQDVAETFHIAESKITSIGAGLTAPQDIIPDGSVLIRHGITAPYVLFLGTLEPRKNCEGLIEAFEIACKQYLAPELASRIQLVLAGNLGWGAKRVFKKRDKSVLKNQIIIAGQISETDKWQLYKQALVFAYPSFYEGIGLPALEAASQGTPVITSSVTSLPEYLGDAALLINPWNITDLAVAIASMIHDEKLRQYFGIKGKEMVQKYKWEDVARKLMNVFENV